MEIPSATVKIVLDKVVNFIHEHPTTTKVIRLAALITGVGLLISNPFQSPFFVKAICGTMLALTSSISFFVLDLLVPPHHDMKNHPFKEGACLGGKLYYENDVPILELDADNPAQAGFAHGYLCGESIGILARRFGLVLHTIARQPRASDLPKTLAAIRAKIPPEYLLEMEGMVKGYNQWISEQKVTTHPKLTVDDALLFHLVPDSVHFSPGEYEGKKQHQFIPVPVVGCTSLVEKDDEGHFVLDRNMDWPTFGEAGKRSFVIHRKHGNGAHSTVEVGVPGVVGTVTGMNDQGLALAMNVCEGKTNEIRGMPASLYNRMILERCSTAQQVEETVGERAPLGPYHLTIAGPDRAESIHFYQLPDNNHAIRISGGQCLATLNWRYSPQPHISLHNDKAREAQLAQFFKNREGKPLAEALALPEVNNWLTAHRVHMKPAAQELSVAFDNAFAGKVPLHKIDVRRLFAAG